MALAFSKQGHQHVGARDFVAAGILHVQNGALHHALEPGGGLGVFAVLNHQGQKLIVDVFEQGLAQRLGVDIAGLHDLDGVGVIGQSEQQVLERGIFVMPVAGEHHRAVQRLLQASRQGRHRRAIPFPSCTAEDARDGGRIQSLALLSFRQPRR